MSANQEIACYYEAGDRIFDCSGTCAPSDAQRVVDYCNPPTSNYYSSESESEEDAGGCSIGSNGSSKPLWTALCLLALGMLRSRRPHRHSTHVR